MKSPLSFRVGAQDDGLRLDVLVARHSGLSRRRAVALIAEGLVRVEGRRLPKGRLPARGDLVEVDVSGGDCALPEASASLDVRCETADYLVVEKAAGQPSVALRRSNHGTLANALVGHYPELVDVGGSPLEAGLVHRLDTFTSGLLVAGRSPAGYRALTSALHQGRLHKAYYAIVSNSPPSDEGQLLTWLGPDRRHPERVVASLEPIETSGAVERALRWRRADSHTGLHLLEVDASRAYRHQIRAQLALLGCPLLGDVLYGGQDAGLSTRHALHACRVCWAGEEGLPGFDVRSELPPDMRRLLGREVGAGGAVEGVFDDG